jgi:hypothetical protein
MRKQRFLRFFSPAILAEHFRVTRLSIRRPLYHLQLPPHFRQVRGRREEAVTEEAEAPLLVNNPVEQSQTCSDGFYSGDGHPHEALYSVDLSSSSFASLRHPLDLGTTQMEGGRSTGDSDAGDAGNRISTSVGAARAIHRHLSPFFRSSSFLPPPLRLDTLSYDMPPSPSPTTIPQSPFPSSARPTARQAVSLSIPFRPFPTFFVVLAPSDALLVVVKDWKGTLHSSYSRRCRKGVVSGGSELMIEREEIARWYLPQNDARSVPLCEYSYSYL